MKKKGKAPNLEEQLRELKSRSISLLEDAKEMGKSVELLSGEIKLRNEEVKDIKDKTLKRQETIVGGISNKKLERIGGNMGKETQEERISSLEEQIAEEKAILSSILEGMKKIREGVEITREENGKTRAEIRELGGRVEKMEKAIAGALSSTLLERIERL